MFLKLDIHQYKPNSVCGGEGSSADGKVLKGQGNKWCSALKGCLMVAAVNRRLHKYSESALSSSSLGLLHTSSLLATLQLRHMGRHKGTWNWTNVLSTAAATAPAKWTMGCVVHAYTCEQRVQGHRDDTGQRVSWDLKSTGIKSPGTLGSVGTSDYL